MITPSKPTINLAGLRFGRLVALSYVATGKKWICQCDCGSASEVPGANLRSGKTRSCGCLKREVMASGMATRHGMFKTRTYKSWNSMVSRCTNPAEPSFKNYGGAGVTVCSAWRDFESFFSDMGERPEGMSLDRIDVRGNYEPGNCRWADAKTQANNRRDNRLVTYNGAEQTIRQICDAVGANYTLVRGRVLRLGWDVQRALDTPTQLKREAA